MKQVAGPRRTDHACSFVILPVWLILHGPLHIAAITNSGAIRESVLGSTTGCKAGEPVDRQPSVGFAAVLRLDAGRAPYPRVC